VEDASAELKHESQHPDHDGQEEDGPKHHEPPRCVLPNLLAEQPDLIERGRRSLGTPRELKGILPLNYVIRRPVRLFKIAHSRLCNSNCVEASFSYSDASHY